MSNTRNVEEEFVKYLSNESDENQTHIFSLKELSNFSYTYTKGFDDYKKNSSNTGDLINAFATAFGFFGGVASGTIVSCFATLVGSMDESTENQLEKVKDQLSSIYRFFDSNRRKYDRIKVRITFDQYVVGDKQHYEKNKLQIPTNYELIGVRANGKWLKEEEY